MGKSRQLVARGAVLACVSLAAVVGAEPVAAAPPKKAVDPAADRLVKQMADYVSGLQSFTVRTAVADEVTMKTGEKVQLMSNAEVAVQRPNHLRSIQRGTAGLGIWYDGQNMTASCTGTGSYQALPAPPTLDAAIDDMRKQFDIDAPGADLLYTHPYDVLMDQVVSGRLVGRETIDGVAVNHVAFRGDQVDWQMWIKDGSEPLPLRYVITTKDAPGHPQFAVQLSDWNTMPNLGPSTFEFKAPPDAKPGKSIVASCVASR